MITGEVKSRFFSTGCAGRKCVYDGMSASPALRAWRVSAPTISVLVLRHVVNCLDLVACDPEPLLARYALRARDAKALSKLIGRPVPARIGQIEGEVACLGPDEWLLRAPAGTTLPDGAGLPLSVVEIGERNDRRARYHHLSEFSLAREIELEIAHEAAQLAEVRREVQAGQDKLRAITEELGRTQIK
mgnify:CR=1 FL=1